MGRSVKEANLKILLFPKTSALSMESFLSLSPSSSPSASSSSTSFPPRRERGEGGRERREREKFIPTKLAEHLPYIEIIPIKKMNVNKSALKT